MRKTLTDKEARAAKQLSYKWNSERKKLKLSQAAAGAVLGIEQSTFNQYINGVIPINLAFLIRVSKLLGTHPKNIYPELWETIEPAIDDINSESVTFVTEKANPTPLYSLEEVMNFANGLPPIASPDDNNRTSIPGGKVGNKETYAIQIIDNSMEPELPKHAFLYIDPLFDPENNSIVIAHSDEWELPLCGRLIKRANKRELHFDNPNYSPLELNSNVSILGVVTEMRRSFY